MLLAVAGCGQKGDALVRAGRKVEEKLEDLAGGPEGQVAGAVGAVRGAVASAAIDSRVQTRLHWDRHLAGAEVRVKLRQPGVVVLQGRVADAKQKRRALDLAGTTLGVEKVVDKLVVRPGQ
jgi:osmotically-inducible protein OsmY